MHANIDNIDGKCSGAGVALLVDAKGVCRLLGIGLSCLYSTDRSGELVKRASINGGARRG